MAGYREARTPTVRGKRIDHLRIRKTEDGVTVEHHYAENGFEHFAPRSYEFAKDESSDLVEHLGKFAGIPVAESTETEDV